MVYLVFIHSCVIIVGDSLTFLLEVNKEASCFHMSWGNWGAFGTVVNVFMVPRLLFITIYYFYPFPHALPCLSSCSHHHQFELA